jgi:Double-GTPase 1
MNIVMVGGPETGKTSYAVVLYGGLSNGAYEEITYLDVHDDVEIFNDELERLAERKPVVRSEMNDAGRLGLSVEHAGSAHDFSIPDRSGEALKESINGREWHPELIAELKEAEALMLFLSPLRLDRGLSTEAIAVGPGEEEGDSVPVPWDASMMPTDVRSVDALQELSRIAVTSPIPIVVVVSAWDVSELDSPREWVERSVPLLHQFLASHQEEFPSTVFGVSVQGSSFQGEEEVPDDEPDPWLRAEAVDADGVSGELCAPLSWILRFSASQPAGE